MATRRSLCTTGLLALGWASTPVRAQTTAMEPSQQKRTALAKIGGMARMMELTAGWYEDLPQQERLRSLTPILQLHAASASVFVSGGRKYAAAIPYRAGSPYWAAVAAYWNICEHLCKSRVRGEDELS